MAKSLRSVLPSPLRPIVSVHPDVVVKQGVEMMVQDNIGALVVGDDENILGILSERDVIRYVVHANKPPESTKISDVMCSDITVLDVTVPVEVAMEAIINTRRRHLLVREDGEIIAILSIGDIVFSLLEDSNRTIDELEKYIHTY
jgi:CBS domain-containing protein